MGIFFGFACILFGIAMLAVPGFGHGVIKFLNDLRGIETTDDTGTAGCVHAGLWIVIGIVFLFTL